MSEPDRGALDARAIYAFRRNLVLAASAGTGKTHALVGVAVHLLMGGCRAREGGLRAAIAPGALVATTFSRKAAFEIRGRLRLELARLAEGDARATYRDDLLAACTDAGVSPFSEHELMTRARRALGQFGRARIGTLHGFATRLVRTHALAAGLSPDFDLPDEETLRERKGAAIERVLERRVDDEDVAALVRLAGGVAPFVDAARDLLARIADDGSRASSLALAENDAAEIDASLKSFIEHARDLVSEPKLGGPARLVVTAFEGGDLDLLEDAAGALCTLPKAGKQSPAAEAFFEHRATLAVSSLSTTNAERGRALVRRWRARDRLLPRARALRDFLVACEGAIVEDNARDSVLGFADVLSAARDVLRDHPSLGRETGAQFDALLVDEFQDTSGVQRDLVLLLWERHGATAEARAPGVVPRAEAVRGEGLLIVGDRKQSIYGFRGADASVFAELCVGLAGTPARLALAIPPGVVREPAEPIADFIALRYNRRGEPELLDFANACSRLSLVPGGVPTELYEVDYVGTTEDLRSPSSAPMPAVTRTRWLRTAVTGHRKTTLPLHEAEVMAARIGCLVRGAELTVRGVPARWQDIAVLAHRHAMLEAVTYTLALAGIPHVVAGMGFYGLREVKDIIAMLACLVDPDDSLACVEVLRGPWAAVTDRTLVGLTDPHAGLADVGRWHTGERRDLIDGVDRPNVEALARVITALRPVIGRIGAAPALRQAVRALSFEETLAVMPRGEQRVANVRKLLSMADDVADPTVFLRRVRRASREEEREGEAATFSDDDDAVRLLTVHASKGLSFPVVFLPESGAVPVNGSRGSMHVQGSVAGRPSTLVLRALDRLGTVQDTPSFGRAKRDALRREAAERKRRLYVSVTRASEAMFFVGDRVLPKGARDTYDTSTAALLVALAADENARLDVERGESLLRRVDPPSAPRADHRSTHLGLPLAPPPAREGRVIHAESLRAASQCARRFQLAVTVGFAPAATSPLTPAVRPRSELLRRLGSLGAWGARVVRESPRLLQADQVGLRVDDPNGPFFFVETVIDLTVAWPDGSLDVVAFTSTAPEAEDDALYVSVLAHASRLRNPSAGAVRVGLVVGDAPGSEPSWRLPLDVASTHDAARAALARIASVPRVGLAPRAAKLVCVRIACDFAVACYSADGGETG